jgi:two-component system chemotaxis response regulator CheB
MQHRSRISGSRGCEIVAIAASTGGPQALCKILSSLPADFPAPVLVVQHITKGFSHGLASWLNHESLLTVTVASHDAPLQGGWVYIAPDDHHLGVCHRRRIKLDDGPPIRQHRPAASYLFQKAAEVFADKALAVVLTGMGDDGTEGLRTLKALGGYVIAQDEATSVVFGMPGVAIKAGLADEVLPLGEIASRMKENSKKERQRP